MTNCRVNTPDSTCDVSSGWYQTNIYDAGNSFISARLWTTYYDVVGVRDNKTMTIEHELCFSSSVKVVLIVRGANCNCFRPSGHVYLFFQKVLGLSSSVYVYKLHPSIEQPASRVPRLAMRHNSVLKYSQVQRSMLINRRVKESLQPPSLMAD